jgi:hypothetical protein
MKGPSGRLKHFVRRYWECPVCHRREWTTGKVVNLPCDCQAKSDPPRQTWMTLIEEEPQTPPPDPGPAPSPPSPLPAPAEEPPATSS